MAASRTRLALVVLVSLALGGCSVEVRSTVDRDAQPVVASEGWVGVAEVEATNPSGTTLRVPVAGTYQVRIAAGSYTTGTHQRSVVAVFVNPPGPISFCGRYHEPCLRPGIDFYVGDFNSAAPGTGTTRDLPAGTLQMVAIDEWASYTHLNAGAVRVEVRHLR